MPPCSARRSLPRPCRELVRPPRRRLSAGANRACVCLGAAWSVAGVAGGAPGRSAAPGRRRAGRPAASGPRAPPGPSTRSRPSSFARFAAMSVPHRAARPAAGGSSASRPASFVGRDAERRGQRAEVHPAAALGGWPVCCVLRCRCVVAASEPQPARRRQRGRRRWRRRRPAGSLACLIHGVPPVEVIRGLGTTRWLPSSSTTTPPWASQPAARPARSAPRPWRATRPRRRSARARSPGRRR